MTPQTRAYYANGHTSVTAFEVMEWFRREDGMKSKIPNVLSVEPLVDIVNLHLAEFHIESKRYQNKLLNIMPAAKNMKEKLYSLLNSYLNVQDLERAAGRFSAYDVGPEIQALLDALHAFLTVTGPRASHRPAGKDWRELAPNWALKVRSVLLTNGWAATTSLSNDNSVVPRVVSAMLKAATDESPAAITVARYLRNAEGRQKLRSLLA